MNVDTGDYYDSMREAVEAGEKEEDLVEVHATAEQIEKLSQAVKMAVPTGKRH